MRTSEQKRERKKEGRKRERLDVKGRKEGRNKNRKKSSKQATGQTKSKCYKQRMYLDIMHCRLQSVITNLFKLLMLLPMLH